MGEIKDPLDKKIDVDEIAKEFDSLSRFRNPKGLIGILVAVIAISMSVFHILTAGVITMNVMQHRYVHYTFAIVLVFLLYPAFKKSNIAKPSALDYIFALLAAISSGYLFIMYDDIVQRGLNVTAIDITMGVITIVLLFEAARRSIGYQLPVLALLFLAFAYFGPYFPGPLSHRGFSFNILIERLFLGNDGIFGIALGVSATYVFLFILFGAFLNGTGMSSLFTNMSIGLAGSRPGGPAKVAILGSGSLGMINGSAVANVATTGVFTIPLMNKVGYKKKFASGVEAVASTGGQITPPIMGSAAFVMAEFLGMPYTHIMIAAIIPALLYFIALWFMVHQEAMKNGLSGLPKDQLPDVKTLLKQRGHLLLPIVLLLVLMFMDYTPIYAAFWAIIATYLISLIRPETRMNFRTLLRTLEEGAKGAAFITMATAVVGIIVGVVSLTGLGLQVGNMVLSLSQGFLFPTLLLTMLACIILGMGLPTTAAYIVAVIVAAPALIQLGVEPIIAHMFVLYFASLSNITPPVALASYTAAGISGSSPTAVSWVALRLGAAGFLVPFIFVYSPELLLQDSNILAVTLALITALIGVYALSTSVIGYWNGKLNIFGRVLLFSIAILLMYSGWLTDIIGISLMVGIYLIQTSFAKRSQSVIDGEN